MATNISTYVPIADRPVARRLRRRRQPEYADRRHLFPSNLLTGTLRVLRANSVPHLLILCAGVTPAEGGVAPIAGSTTIKFLRYPCYCLSLVPFHCPSAGS